MSWSSALSSLSGGAQDAAGGGVSGWTTRLLGHVDVGVDPPGGLEDPGFKPAPLLPKCRVCVRALMVLDHPSPGGVEVSGVGSDFGSEGGGLEASFSPPFLSLGSLGVSGPRTASSPSEATFDRYPPSWGLDGKSLLSGCESLFPHYTHLRKERRET